MRLIDTIKRAGRSLRQAKARTLLTSLAIGVGAFTITLSLAAGAGGRQYAADIVSANTNAQELRVTQKQDALTDFNKPQEYTDDSSISYGHGLTIKQLSQADINKISKVDGVASVVPTYTFSVKYVTASGAKKYQASAAVYDTSISQVFVAGNGNNLTDNEVIIPESYASVLGLGTPQQAIGKTIDVVVTEGTSNPLQPIDKTFSFKVAGVTGTNPLTIGAGSNLLVTAATTKTLYEYNTQGTPLYGKYLAVLVYAKDNVNVNTIKDAINNQGYQAQTAADLLTTIFQFINVLQAILLGFGALAILTSIFGIINTQYISVLERTQQIGLMKALGMRRRDVGRLFKLEAAWIGFLGGAIGSGIALLAGTIANPYITDFLKLGKGTNLLIFQPEAIIAIIIGLMVVAVGAGILPARKAAKLDPIEALRTE